MIFDTTFCPPLIRFRRYASGSPIIKRAVSLNVWGALTFVHPSHQLRTESPSRIGFDELPIGIEIQRLSLGLLKTALRERNPNPRELERA